MAKGNAHALRKRPVEDFGNVRRLPVHVSDLATSRRCVWKSQPAALTQSTRGRACLQERHGTALHGDDADGLGPELSEGKVRLKALIPPPLCYLSNP